MKISFKNFQNLVHGKIWHPLNFTKPNNNIKKIKISPLLGKGERYGKKESSSSKCCEQRSCEHIERLDETKIPNCEQSEHIEN